MYQQNNLYGFMDTCLSNIDDIYLITGDKKRRLIPRNIVSSKIKGKIFIVCKVFKRYFFSKISNKFSILHVIKFCHDFINNFF